MENLKSEEFHEQHVYSSQERYFRVDDGYDKRVYENDWKNVIKITIAFTIFYSVCLIIFWGEISLGMSFSDAYMWKNVALFIFTWLFFIAYLWFGRK